MKCVKTILKDISFYSPNLSDEQGTSYGCFSGFLGPLGCSEEKFKCLGGPLEVILKINLLKFWFANEIQHCALVTVFKVLVLYIFASTDFPSHQQGSFFLPAVIHRKIMGCLSNYCHLRGEGGLVYHSLKYHSYKIQLCLRVTFDYLHVLGWAWNTTVIRIQEDRRILSKSICYFLIAWAWKQPKPRRGILLSVSLKHFEI